MDAIVLGAAGFCGQEIASQALAESGYEKVIALYRNQPKQPLCESRFSSVIGCLKSLNYSDLFPQRPHVIFHFATSKDRLQDNLLSCEQVIKSVNPYCRGIIYGSSLSVYGDGPHHSVSEDSELRPQTELARNRAQCEATLRQNDKAPVICLRPRMIIGRQDQYFLPKIGKLFRRGMTVGNELQRISLIEVRDYAKLALQIGTFLDQDPAQLSPAYNVGYESPLSILELRKIIAPNKVLFYRIPVGFSLGLFNWLPFRFAKRLSTRLSLIGRDQTLDASRLMKVLGKRILGQSAAEKVKSVLNDNLNSNS